MMVSTIRGYNFHFCALKLCNKSLSNSLNRWLVRTIITVIGTKRTPQHATNTENNKNN